MHGTKSNRLLTRFLCALVVMWLFGALSLKVLKRNDEVMARSPVARAETRDVQRFDPRRLGLGVPDAAKEYEYEDRQKLSADGTREMDRFRFIADPLLPFVDCAGVISGDENALDHARLERLELLMSKTRELERKELFDSFEVELTRRAESNCTKFISWRRYVVDHLSDEERAFPLAYVLTIHKNLAMFERLLRAIYRPQNIYCVHVDQKSSEEFRRRVQLLTHCFDNVFMTTQAVSVHYSHYSRVQADLNCLGDLLARREQTAWKYVMNLCGQDYPLKTNLDIVRSLKNLFGYNNVETISMPVHKKKRYEFVYKLPADSNHEHGLMEKTDTKKSPSPLDTPMFAGSAYYVLTYDAIKFILTDDTVHRFLEWNKDSYSPDEHIWATLQRWYPMLPGSVPPHPKYDRNELTTIVRLVKWAGLDEQHVYSACAGRYERGVCVYGVGDLSWLLAQPHLFANKFDPRVDVFAVECLDHWLRNRTALQHWKFRTDGFL